jgi:hypothetical protein
MSRILWFIRYVVFIRCPIHFERAVFSGSFAQSISVTDSKSDRSILPLNMAASEVYRTAEALTLLNGIDKCKYLSIYRPDYARYAA